MHFPAKLLTLPTSLLLLLLNGNLAQTIEVYQSPAPWPYSLPKHVKYWPEDPPNRRRDVEAIKHLVREGHPPTEVKKMSDNPDDKFFPEYWGFSDQEMQTAILGIGNSWALRHGYQEEEDESRANRSAPLTFRPPFPIHTEKVDSLKRRDIFEAARNWVAERTAKGKLASLRKRGFECVTGTSACSSIDQPNLCCATGETCYHIPDTGLGTVGCCPAGATCGGSITCADGNAACLVNNTGGYTGGGCCIPGYVCSGVGCVLKVSVVTSTKTQIISASTSIVVVTETVRPSITAITSTTTETDTALQTTMYCSSSYHACPINLGGGCCPKDQACHVGSCPASTKTTPASSSATSQTSSTSSSNPVSATGVVPLRGTSVSSTITPTDTTCPTGFYACSATYGGGCCQTGRDCQTTNCPAKASTTIISSGLTVVVPLTPSATTTARGSCATGWSSCPAASGGACCPSSWKCGTISCYSSLGAGSTASQPKEGVILGNASMVRSSRSMVYFIACINVILGLWMLT